MAAVRSRLESLETVQILLDYKAEVNAKDHQGATALMKASRHSVVKIVQLLLDHGAEVNAKDTDNGTALMEASGVADSIETVRTLGTVIF